jgi:hypothetical protein
MILKDYQLIFMFLIAIEKELQKYAKPWYQSDEI